MKMNEILEAIEMLASSQGFYGRLLNSINSLPIDEYERVATELEGQNFKDVVDMVMFFEC